MTKDQFDKFKQIEEEIKPIRDFLLYCGSKRPVDYRTRFSLLPNFKNFSLWMKWHSNRKEDCLYEIPDELQCRIVSVIEDYLDEREKEKEAL